MDRTAIRERPLKPAIIRPSISGPLLLLGIGAVLAIELTIVMSSPETPVGINLSGFAAALALMGSTLIWQWLCRYTIAVDDDGVSVSTNYWRLRRRPPVHFSPAGGIAVSSNGAFWHRSVDINGLHVEAPELWAHNSLRDALTDASLPPEQRSAFWANAAGVAAGAPAIAVWAFAMYDREYGPLVMLVVGVAVAALYVVHFARVDRQWQKVAAAGR